MICKIAMNGFLGRMGQSIFQESNNQQDVEITVGCDSDDKINSIENNFNLTLTSDITKFSESFDVVIDFSLPTPSLSALNKCVGLQKAISIGTTGFNSNQLDIIAKASKTIPILMAPNMSQGVNVALKSLSSMSRALKGYKVLIKEVHHINKVDSPSGTAIKMAHVICDSQNIPLGDVKSSNCPIKFESLRQDTEIGTHEVIFTDKNDEIRLTHIANDRSIFAKGAIQTAKWIKDQSPGLYSYSDFMEDTL
jgi:4-hydroxy-tetrahydrodipicolinate reductase